MRVVYWVNVSESSGASSPGFIFIFLQSASLDKSSITHWVVLDKRAIKQLCSVHHTEPYGTR